MFTFLTHLQNYRNRRRALARCKSRVARSRNVRLQLEPLEDRAVPTIVFTPNFGPETIASGTTNDGLHSPTVNLVFSGSYWNTTPGQQDEATFIDSTKSILSGPYLSGLTQYGSDGHANFGTSWVNPATVATNGPSVSSLQSFLQNSIISHNPLLLIPPQPETIYVVISDPASSQTDITQHSGWNSHGILVSWLFPSVPINMIWVGTLADSSTHVTKDFFTTVLSHELAEAISDPGSNGGVSAPSGLPASFQRGPQIADNEPDGGGVGNTQYTYRLNGNHGDLVQAYWSQQDHAYIVPDGNVQKFNLVPKWDGSSFVGKFTLNIVGDQLGANFPDNIVIGLNGNPHSASMNNESATFTDQHITTINVNTGGGSNSIQVISFPQFALGLPVTLNLNSDFANSHDTIVIDSSIAGDSLVGLGGTININYSSGQASVFVNDSGGPPSAVTISDHSVSFSDRFGDPYPTINYDAAFRDPLGNLHGVTSLTVHESVGSSIDAESVGALTATSIFWEPGLFGTPWVFSGLLTGPAAHQVHIIGPFLYGSFLM